MPSKEDRRKALEDQLAALDAEDDEPEYEYEFGTGDSYARVSSKSKAGRKLDSWFKEKFGIDLSDEPVQEPAEPEPEGKGKARAEPKGQQGQGPNVRAFKRASG